MASFRANSSRSIQPVPRHTAWLLKSFSALPGGGGGGWTCDVVWYFSYIQKLYTRRRLETYAKTFTIGSVNSNSPGLFEHVMSVETRACIS